jgi:hypothetical protein
MKNKRSAFEMSITTIVILVIAMIMLILGIMLVRKIMCGGMNIAEETLAGAQSQINKLFGEESGQEIVCAGTKDTVTIIPGRDNIVGCGATPSETSKTYTYDFTIRAYDINNNDISGEVNKWIIGSKSGTRQNIKPGQTAYLSFNIHPPKNAPYASIEVTPKINGEDQNIMRLQVKNIGWLRQTAC